MRGGRPYQRGRGNGEAKELIINATGAASGGTNLVSVLRWNKLDRGVRMWHHLRKRRHLPKKQKMCWK